MSISKKLSFFNCQYSKEFFLLTIIGSQIGGAFIFDNPAVLKQEMVSNFKLIYDEHISQTLFGMMYSMYSLPNVIIPLINGIIIDRYGIRPMAIMLSFLIMLGAFLTFAGSLTQNPILMIFGRIIYGIGNESQASVLIQFIFLWFQKKQLFMAQGVFMCSNSLVSVLNAYLTPKISCQYGINNALLFGFMICLFSLFSVLMVVFIDIQRDRQLNTQEVQLQIQQRQNQLSFFNHVKEIQNLNQDYWKYSLFLAIGLSNFICFNAHLQEIIITQWLPNSPQNDSQKMETAGQYMAITFLASSFTYPIIGYVVDKYGRTMDWLFFSSINQLVASVLIMIKCQILPLILMGLTLSIQTTLGYPVIAQMINKKYLAIAYGAATALFDTFLVIIQTVNSQLTCLQDDNHSIILLFTVLNFLCLLLLLNIYFFSQQQEDPQVIEHYVQKVDKSQNDISFESQQSEENQNLIIKNKEEKIK